MKDYKLNSLKNSLKKVLDGECLAGMFYDKANGIVFDLIIYFDDYKPTTAKQESYLRDLLMYLDYLEYPEDLPLERYYFNLSKVYDLVIKGKF